MAVRNFWLAATIDGRSTRLEGEAMSADTGTTTGRTISKVLYVGTTDVGTTDVGRRARAKVFVRVKYDGRLLSLTGVEGPRANGDCWGSCGQIGMGWTDDYLADLRDGDLDAGQVRQLREVWGEWHLNDMRAGTPRQLAYLAGHKFPGYPASHYEWAVGVLKSAGLDPDNGHLYGSAWLFEPVPSTVLDFLDGLPASSGPVCRRCTIGPTF